MMSRSVTKAFCKGLDETTHGFGSGLRKATNYFFWVKPVKVSHRDLTIDSSGRWRPGLASLFAPMGVCIYVATSAASFGLKWDIPLMALALVGILTIVCRVPNAGAIRSRLSFGVLAFLISTGLSILVSADIGRSLRLSVPLLPGALLFLLIAYQFHRPGHIRMLYLTFAGLGLLLASTLLWVAWTHLEMKPTDWVSGLGSPMLLVPNDVIFLGVMAPLSLWEKRGHIFRCSMFEDQALNNKNDCPPKITPD